jgi:hypothetical protein
MAGGAVCAGSSGATRVALACVAQNPLGMAAIMALIFVPALAAVGFMVMSNIGTSPAGTVASICFAVLAMGVFAALFKLARRWEQEELP